MTSEAQTGIIGQVRMLPIDSFHDEVGSDG